MVTLGSGLCVLLLGVLPVTVSGSGLYDVVVYDASSGGVMAAVAAARHGMKTILLCASWPSCFPEGGKRIGGMSSGGLGQTDIGTNEPWKVYGGLADEFYARNRRRYEGGPYFNSEACRLPSASCTRTYNLEPHVAQDIFTEMLREAGVEVHYASQVASVIKEGPAITCLTTTTGDMYWAKVYIDASYEGDLFHSAGISYTIGRESRSQYNESLAGRQGGGTGNFFNVAVDPYDGDGNPLPLLHTLPSEKPGEGDRKVQAYNFRLCVTKNTTNQIPFPKPSSYNSSTWELLRRYISACDAAECKLGFPSCSLQPVPNGKYDMNNCGGLSTDLIGGSWGYPNASYAERKAIWTAHRDYVQGLLWTMAHGDGVSEKVKAEMRAWGLCKDEFPETGGFPPALYVRSARRMVGDKVFTQNTPSEQRNASIGMESIGLGCYNFDSHNADRFVCPNKSACGGYGPHGVAPDTPYAWDEGDVEISPGKYQIPIWALLPKHTEGDNLLAIAAPSASHIGMSTLRMEPVFMVIGHSAGVIASLVVNSSKTVHGVNRTELHTALLRDGQILEVP